ncbi:preprotein translocase subunit YajC [Desulfonauticus submarinus]|uniref:Sec translocon accessory complex subunit YajC n=1 Tax=Desulfonauticus submarinus TaxID=206665 RepID=A0A1H0CP29_9BACT|nr:preprotein translocase subunit YajC [Desulfonauticus submarinus]SDN59642.1 preprotein translocase subunit YajC [Desulfonauticus submarinus]
MDLVSVAHAMGQAGGASGGGQPNPLGAFLPLLLMFAIFYFLLIRPQQKKAKQHKEMLASLRKGDRVMTGGGLYGRIVDLDGEVVTVQLADNVEVKVNRGYIAAVVNPEKQKTEGKSTKKGK